MKMLTRELCRLKFFMGLDNTRSMLIIRRICFVLHVLLLTSQRTPRPESQHVVDYLPHKRSTAQHSTAQHKPAQISPAKQNREKKSDDALVRSFVLHPDFSGKITSVVSHPCYVAFPGDAAGP